jgi:ribA/ribD-fused uncharacterized protein
MTIKKAKTQPKEKFWPFYGGPFSQWAACKFTIDGMTFNCAEQYMMVKKALLFRDMAAAQLIMETADPLRQKAIGREVQGFDPVVWGAVSRDVVYRGSSAKFLQNGKLRRRLIDTRGYTLVEASETDTVWGVGLAEWDARVHHRDAWQGTNWLGQVLTDLRLDLEKAGVR